MTKTHFGLGLLVASTALGIVSAGCGNHTDGSQTLAQQRASVMGAPAPASEKANIAALQAANAQRASQAQKSQPPAQQPPK